MKKTPTVETLKNRVAKLTHELCRINEELDFLTKRSGNSGASEVQKNYYHHGTGRPKIIPFPGTGYKPPEYTKPKFSEPAMEYMAMPGMPLSPDIHDYRQSLQRDGLILLGWDKRDTEAGERFTAYWVTSTGTARFYASKQYESFNFPMAQPDHKSYAAEDGIEFYGQDAPAYIVHTAPELMMSNPRHGELRTSHISKLKQQGISVDFMYKYLLTYEKCRTAKKTERAGA